MVVFFLQVCDISARIAALKSAGLNLETPQSRFTKTKTIPVMVRVYIKRNNHNYVKHLVEELGGKKSSFYILQPVTVDSTRQLRRRLPAPPVKGKKHSALIPYTIPEYSALLYIQTLHTNRILYNYYIKHT